MKQIPPVYGLTFLLLFGAVLLFGSGYTYYMQRSGTPAQATATSCMKHGRAYVCRGLWFADGRLHSGYIENAHPSEQGQRIEVRTLGERAIKPGLRLPIVLLSMGLAIFLLGWRWWSKEAPRARPS